LINNTNTPSTAFISFPQMSHLWRIFMSYYQYIPVTLKEDLVWTWN
jgi:hypothetical protein